MNLIRAKSLEQGWDLDLGEMARIWKGGCIIRARFLDRIKQAYDKDADLPSLLVDGEFAAELVARNDPQPGTSSGALYGRMTEVSRTTEIDREAA